MGSVWDLYGICIKSIWDLYGILRDLYGIYMGSDHTSGHTLDLVITRATADICRVVR